MQTWKLKTEISKSTPQKLVAYQQKVNDILVEGNASKNLRRTSLIVAPKGIDLTMKISGQVFLDMDNGKINTGNDMMDGNSEALQGVEVILYDETNTVVARVRNIQQLHEHNQNCYAQVTHVHTGDPYEGGGCYTKRIHYHDGNILTPGACYQPVTHTHTGSPTGGTAIHIHTPACYHNHTSACITGGTGHIHTDSCKKLHMHTENCGWTCPEAGGYECSVCGEPLEYLGDGTKDCPNAYNEDHKSGWWEVYTGCNTFEECKAKGHTRFNCGKTEGQWYGEYSCGQQEGSSSVGTSHTHTSACYHTHTSECGGQTGHIHTEACYQNNGWVGCRNMSGRVESIRI